MRFDYKAIFVVSNIERVNNRSVDCPPPEKKRKEKKRKENRARSYAVKVDGNAGRAKERG